MITVNANWLTVLTPVIRDMFQEYLKGELVCPDDDEDDHAEIQR